MFDKISVRLRLAFEFLKVLPLIVFAVRLREVAFLISRVFAGKDSLGGSRSPPGVRTARRRGPGRPMRAWSAVLSAPHASGTASRSPRLFLKLIF